MREILFRGKRIDNGEWVYGYYVEPNFSWHKYGKHKEWIVCSAISNGGWFCLGERHAIIPETIGQYIGLKDENGNKIFEGDVVKDQYEEIGVVEFNTENVASCGCCYEFFTGTGFRAENICLHSCEIIGNIYDNPELIKDGE